GQRGGRLRHRDRRRGAECVRLLRARTRRAGGRGDGGGGRGARSGPRHARGRGWGRGPSVTPPVIVQKYGGTSVGSAARIRRVSKRIKATVDGGRHVVAVVSAMGHTTDRLID